MTIIAWDGKTLVADRLATWGQKSEVKKIFRNGSELIGIAGSAAIATGLRQWLINSRQEKEWPSFGKDFTATAIVINNDGVFTYYSDVGPWPVKHEEPFIAIGCGKSFAMAAMYLGKSAKEAVEITCVLDSECGNGIDILEY